MDLVTWFFNGWALAVILAVVICGYAVKEHRHYSRQFEELGNHIREALGLLSSIATPVDFYQRLRTTARALDTNPSLGKRWREYKASLIPARGERPLRSPHSASEFFNEDLYRESGIDVRAYEALPNQFVGVGLCFTFLGLILSLFIAQSVITANANEATGALSDLLQAASFKFITSVVALVSSVVFVFAKNRRLYSTEKLIGEFCEQLERLVPPVTPEELAEESNAELARQGEQLEAANRILASGIADALEQKLVNAMIIGTEPMTQTIRTMTERLSDINRSALEHMAQRFAETLSGAAHEHSERMAEMLKQSADAIGEAPEQIRAAARAVSEELKVGTGAIDRSLQSWSAEMVNASDLASKAFLARLDEHTGHMATALNQESVAILESIGAIADELSLAPQRIIDAGAAFHEAASSATQNMQVAVTAAGAQVSGAFDDAASRIQASTGALDQLIEKADNAAEKVQLISADLTNQLGAIFSGSKELTDKLGDLARQVLVAGDAAQSLAGMAGRMEQLAAQLGEGVSSLGTIAELNQATTKETQSLVAQLGERARAMAGELSTLEEAIARAFDKTKEGFDQLGGRTAEYMSQVDSGMAQGMERFATAIRDFDRTVERISILEDARSSSVAPSMQPVR